MKKFTALLIALVLTVGLFAGCGAASGTTAGTAASTASSTAAGAESSGTGEAKPFKYGFVSWGTADEHGRTLNAAVEWAVKAAGGEFVMDGSAITAETTIAAAENLIQSGCNMLSFCTYAGEATVPQISKLCQENGVYWTMWDTTIADESIQKMIDEDPYYVGNTNEDQYVAGYNTMKALIEQGATKVILFKYGVNIPTCDDRCEGAYAAAKELGAEILYEVVAPEDYKKAASDALVAYPDTDCFFLAGSGSKTADISSAALGAGKTAEDFYIGAFDYFDAMGEMLKTKELDVINGGHMITGTFSALMAINAYFGTPLSDTNYMVTVPYLTLTSYEDYEAYKEYASEGAAYTDEEMQQYLKVYNPDMTQEGLQTGASAWSVADIKARKGM